MNALLASLLASPEPAICYKTLCLLDGERPSLEQQAARRTIAAASPLVQTLLNERSAQGVISRHPYAKWAGAHWVLACLAEIGYPPGDESLRPLQNQSLDWLLGAAHFSRIQTIAGRVRRCASQEGNALWYALTLGLPDPRLDELARRLLSWQWPDGGWNCDKHPEADTSSFMETLIPLRALAAYARLGADAALRDEAAATAKRAAEVFLSRSLYRRRRDGQVMDANFVLLHYPVYWHYDILAGLKVLAETGLISDPRGAAALDLLESKRLSDGGFPAEHTYVQHNPAKGNYSPADWGGVNRKRANPFVTLDALYVLQAAGRMTLSSAERSGTISS